MVGAAILAMSGVLSEERNSNTKSLEVSKRKVAKRKTDVGRCMGIVAGPRATPLWTVPVGTPFTCRIHHSGAF